jgi:hypothetical protein
MQCGCTIANFFQVQDATTAANCWSLAGSAAIRSLIMFGLATDRCTHPPSVSYILFATFYKDLARRSRAREKKDH